MAGDIRIDRDSAVSLYEQIRQIFEAQIVSGQLRPGEMLPSEREICELYGVSRITVVRALGDLARLGLIRRVHGKGSIVASARVTRSLHELAGFTETVRRHGLTTRARVLAIDAVADALPAELAELVGTADGRYTKLRRLRYVNRTPAVISTSFIREELFRAMSGYDLEASSFYEVFERILGKPVTRSDRFIKPVVADAEVAELLAVEPGTAHLTFHGVTYIEGDVPIELSQSVFRSDLFDFKASVHRVRESLN